MEEYQKAKAQQLEDNAKFVECVKILGYEASYFSGMYTCKDNGKFVGCHTAAVWLAIFSDAVEQARA